MSEQLHLDIRGQVARVTLNRPSARNALSRALNLELLELAHVLAQNADVHAIVLRGAGEQAFCAGADLKERKGVSAAETGPFVDAIGNAINAWADLPQPTIAALNGYAFGGGVELALACDFRIACDHVIMALTEVRLGILPGAGGTQRLPRLVGLAKAKELILLGRRIDARQAEAIGLVNQVVGREQLDAAVDAMLAELAGCAPISVRKAKEAITRGLDVPLGQGLGIERECYNVTLFTDDRNEGLAAFAEKRQPAYQGK